MATTSRRMLVVPDGGEVRDGSMNDTVRQPGMRPGSRGTSTVVLISVLLAIFGLVLVGLPGAVVLEPAMGIAELAFSARLDGDQTWPAALTISAVGPFALIVAHLLLRRMRLGLRLHALLSAILGFAVVLLASVAGVVVVGH